jgi:hypothetical protein
VLTQGREVDHPGQRNGCQDAGELPEATEDGFQRTSFTAISFLISQISKVNRTCARY